MITFFGVVRPGILGFLVHEFSEMLWQWLHILLQCSAHSGLWWSSLEPVGHHSLANNHHFCK